jgi:hypothetical protein
MPGGFRRERGAAAAPQLIEVDHQLNGSLHQRRGVECPQAGPFPPFLP